MLPHHGFHAQLWDLAHNIFLIMADPYTPGILRRCLKKTIRKIKRKLPSEALMIVEAAEAEAAIKATAYLRRDFPNPSDSSPES